MQKEKILGLLISKSEEIRKVIDNYYRYHEADDFFRIDDIVKLCSKYDITTEEFPYVMEMRNIIVMG